VQIARFAEQDGIHATAINALSLIRVSQPTDPIHAVHKPALCIVAQGRKQVMLADEVYLYDASQYLVVTLDLPIVGQVVQASRNCPYLCLRLDLEPAEVSALLLSPGLPASSAAPGSPNDERCLFLGDASLPLIEAALRLLRLLATPEDIPILAPLAMREILYRLLRSEHGERLRRIALAGSQAQRVARAISWVKLNYARPLRIEAMAREVGMSASALHHQFKAATAMSPLQYQKQLRLQEARRLMLGEVVDAATAGYRVGYESSSQFSREYSRLFGAPPQRDIGRMRQAS
jgi:AraC-like DNA-binding protein